MSRYLLFLLGGVAFAGQSIQLSNSSVGSSSVPAQPAGNNYRVEYSVHDWSPSLFAGTTFVVNSVGLVVQFLNLGGGDIRLQMYTATAAGGSYGVCQFRIGALSPPFVTVRYQEDGTNKVDYCQAWDINGNLVNNTASFYTSQTGTNSAGIALDSSAQNISVAYFRAYTSIVATNARPPITADSTTGCLVYWKFDLGNNTGSLNDSCTAGPYPATMSAGSPVYVPTPGQSLVVAVLRTVPAPVWGNYASLRAGFPAQLDGTTSYSQSDGGGASLSYFWQVLSAPSPPIWSSRTSSTPTVRGLIFGDYQFALSVTDSTTGGRATAIQDIGAVATDSNGVVINADPDIDFLFGPMIAWGRNPWGYQDYFALHASQLRQANYISQGWAPVPQWERPGQGTVSFYVNCVGPQSFCNSSLGTTLSAPVAATDTTISVTAQTRLDLTSLPTHIILYNGSQSEEIRICAAASNVLSVCYDGRGQTPLAFASGSSVLQAKVTGTGTRFLTDPTAPVCPVGAPGPPGPSAYSTGTIALTANSATVNGAGTTFTSAMAGDYIRIPATHGGTSFVFVAQIVSFNSATSLTLNRVYPASADTTSGLAYNIMVGSRTIVLRYPHQTDPSGLGELMWGTTGGCESETAVYTNPVFQGNSFASGHDIVGTDGVLSAGNIYSVTDTTGWINEGSAGGINFYGEGMAHRALYYRSGLNSALAAARVIDNYWIRSPLGNADGNGYPRLFLGGGGIGSFISKIADPASLVGWSDLRGYGGLGVQMVNGIASQGCNAWDDTRDSGYAYAWLILAAIYDPDTTSTAAPGGIPWRTYWQNQLAQMKTNDTNCQNQTAASNNSFANGFLWNANQPALTLTNGSAAATGTGIPSSLCNGTSTGTATLINGSNSITVLTGSIPAGTNALFLTGTTGGGITPFVQYLAYGPGVLGGYWMGDSATVNWISANIDGFPGDGAPVLLTIATGNNDLTNMQKNWQCVWNSSTSITLNRPWDGLSSDVSHVYHPYAPGGFGQQPFMLGIKSYGENLLATQTLPALSGYVAPYQTFTTNSTSWIWNNGMDHQLLGTNYGRVFQQCEPANTAPPGTSLIFRSATCTYGNDPTAVYLSREQNSETGAAHAIYYQNNPTSANQTLGDQFYGALWGYCPWTTGGVFCDPNSTAANAGGSNLADNYITVGKWFGFFSGVGMSHRWPAVRLGGAQPARPRTVVISSREADVPMAASVSVLITAPSGAQANFPCVGATCTVTVDDRQGTHLYQIQYLSSTGKVLSQSIPDLIQ